MWRALFLALGIYCSILGVECLLIDKAILSDGNPNASAMTRATQRMTSKSNDVVPPPWAPWSLMSTGAVVIIYSFTLPQRMKTG